MTDGFTVDEDDYLSHYGIIRKSGRYPWGSGEDVQTRSGDFLSLVNDLRKQGLSDPEIAKRFHTDEHPFSTTELRATTSIARNQKRAADISMAQRLKDKGYSNVAIAEKMGLAGESSVRALLEPGAKIRTDRLQAMANILKDQVAEKEWVDVGVGTEHFRGVSRTQMDTALSMLKSEGYEVINVQVPQVGVGGNQKTLVKVLTPPGTTYKDVVTNPQKIKALDVHTPDEGLTFTPVTAPISLDSKRLVVNYSAKNSKDEEVGGGIADGVMYIRPGVKDLNMGGSNYAQVRIAVDGTHYLKGMAVYKDDLPKGADIVFNTNKSDTGNKLDALKKMNLTPDGKLDIDNPFGASIKPGGQRGVLNIVNEEGDWAKWSKNLASQMLSKQKPSLADQQLRKAHDSKQKELDEILALTNPAVKRRLLQSYSDSVDSAAVHLKAAALPRQATQVILPVSSLRESEIYAPQFRDGERVALVRFPHGGKFEIPELTVNNRNADAAKLLGTAAKDAVGINHKVAERLSGADFDGDTVLVIPNNSGKVKSEPALEGLKNFDPKVTYAAYDGMRTIDGGHYNAATRKVEIPEGKKPKSLKGLEMGKVSNLITDMTIKGANNSELARAVRHSMVVIDAEKHALNYKQSAIDNGIQQLKKKYQASEDKDSIGASTLISRTSREVRVDDRKQSFKIDPETGEKIWRYTGETYVNKKGKTVPKTVKSVEGAEVKNAHLLSSGTVVESIYADHANRMKALGNSARKSMVATKSTPYSPSAKNVYSKEVATLDAKLNIALKNAPKERQAQLLANAIVKQKRDANPDMDSDEIKKISGRALTEARTRTGAGKDLVEITDSEWEAIQAGAISNNKLDKILNNTDLDRVKELATPRKATSMTSSKLLRANQLLASGRTPSEVADIIGVPLSTLNSSLVREGIDG